MIYNHMRNLYCNSHTDKLVDSKNARYNQLQSVMEKNCGKSCNFICETKHAFNPNVFIKPITYCHSINCMYIHVMYYKFYPSSFGNLLICKSYTFSQKEYAKNITKLLYKQTYHTLFKGVFVQRSNMVNEKFWKENGKRKYFWNVFGQVEKKKNKWWDANIFFPSLLKSFFLKIERKLRGEFHLQPVDFYFSLIFSL